MSAFRVFVDIVDENRSVWLTMISPGTDDLETARKIAKDYFLPDRVLDVRWRTEEGQEDGA